MGCDIHIAVQIQDPGFSSWNTAEIPVYDGRNYSLFYVLAGVRGNDSFDPIQQGRGLPEGVTQEDGELDYADHSFGWVTLEEVINFPHWDEPEPRYENMTYRDGCCDFLDWVQELKEEYDPCKVRLVFGFDS